jgi:hypothetical protein
VDRPLARGNGLNTDSIQEPHTRTVKLELFDSRGIRTGKRHIWCMLMVDRKWESRLERMKRIF